MSATDPNDPRDPRFDAAWRAASHEEPPKALDDAIRAAARREVRAGAQAAEVKTASVPSALRPESWWAPLAAAAAIGAIAIGLLQLTNSDHVGAPASDKAVVTDMPEAPAKAKVREEPTGETAAPAAPQIVVPPVARSQAPQAPPASEVTRERSAPMPPPALRKDAAAAASVDERAAINAATPAAEPFPADAVKREAQQADVVAAPPVSMPAEAGTSGMAAGKLSSAPAPAAQGASMRDAQSSTLPVAQTPAPRPAMPIRRLQESESTRAATAAGGAAGTELDAAADARAKTQARLAVPDWIALIRKLRDDGKLDDAAKELTAFRTAHPDHERLLPPDLRDWKPAAR